MLVSMRTTSAGGRASRSTRNLVEQVMLRAARSVWVLAPNRLVILKDARPCPRALNEGADGLARLSSRYRRGDRDLNDEEYRRRAAGIAKGFAAAYRLANQAGSP